MGLDNYGVRFLLTAKSARGVDFERVAMIGRQSMNLDAETLRKNLADFGYKTASDIADFCVAEDMLRGYYAEAFLRSLGSKVVDSFDASDFEGCTYTHDFNDPIPGKFTERYSLVVDGGTLEHIFNVRTALNNVMEMVEVGGHFIGISPSNDCSGHGFYQFSPELFYRVFCPQNGFKLKTVCYMQGNNELAVKDPAVVQQRVGVNGRGMIYLYVLAQRIDNGHIFTDWPQQSDYALAWKSKQGS